RAERRLRRCPVRAGLRSDPDLRLAALVRRLGRAVVRAVLRRAADGVPAAGQPTAAGHVPVLSGTATPGRLTGFGVIDPVAASNGGVDEARVEAAIRELLIAIGEDPSRDGLQRTPTRVARAYAEMFAG